MKKPTNTDFYAVPEGDIAELMRLKRAGVWEAALFESPFVIDDDKGAFHPTGGMAADSASGFLFNVRIFDRGTSPIQILGDVLREGMRKNGLLPETIRVIGSEQVEGLGPFALMLGIFVRKARSLPTIETALRSMHRRVAEKARRQRPR